MKHAVTAILVLFFIITAFAEIPQLISYQGRLENGITGEPMAGTFILTFELYEVETGGSPIWMETHTVEADSNGLYSVMLGSMTPFAGSADFAMSYWLEISIDDSIELVPRYQLGSSPYAIHSEFADFSFESEITNSIDWNDINNVPQGFADGIDDVGSGGGGVGGSGADNYISRWNGSTDLESSIVYQADGGNIGIGTTNPQARLEIEDAPGTGLIIDNPGLDGIFVSGTSNDGIVIDSAGDDGIEIKNSTNHGVYAHHVNDDGIYVVKPGHHGIEVDSACWAGMYISNPAYNGIDINASTSSGCGIKIFSHSGAGHPDTGLVIRDMGHNGIYIESTVGEGIRTFNVPTALIVEGGDNPINTMNNSDDAIHIYNPGGDGVDVMYPGDNCFECDGTGLNVPRFRVSRDCEVFSPSYERYIVDDDGIGITTPMPSATAHWLEHIGEAQLSGGECRIDLPQSFLEGVTINEKHPMQVFLTPYGHLGDYTVERGNNYFIVRQIEGDPNAKFAYKIHAKVWGKENDGIEQVDLKAEQD